MKDIDDTASTNSSCCVTHDTDASTFIVDIREIELDCSSIDSECNETGA